MIRYDCQNHHCCRNITADGIRLPVLWTDDKETRKRLTALHGKPVSLEFELKDASLFSFEFLE